MKKLTYLGSIILLFFFFSENKAFAQKDVKPLSKIPFTTFVMHTYIDISINGSDKKYCFIFDTGAGLTVIDKDFVKELSLIIDNEKVDLTSSGDVNKVEVSKNNRIKVDQLNIDNVQFYIEDLSNLKSPSKEKKLCGIIGFDLLKKFVSFINYQDSYIELYQPNTKLYPEAASLPFFLYEDELPAFESIITTKSGKQLTAKLIFDSGAGFTVNLATNFAKKNNLIDELEVKIKVPVIGAGINSKSENYISSLHKFSFSDFKFSNVPVNFSLTTTGALAQDDIDGIIGMDLIKRFNVVLDYKSKNMKLIPNSNYNSPFNFNLTGLSFISKDNNIIVFNVMPNSPASKAGFKKDDIIVSVNDEKYTSTNELKTALNIEDKFFNVKIKRDDATQLLVLKAQKFY